MLAYAVLHDATADPDEIPTAARNGAFAVVPDDYNPEQYAVWLNGNVIGTIGDELGTIPTRGRYAAWSPNSGTRTGHLGFFGDLNEAARAIKDLHPEAVDTTGPKGQTKPTNRDAGLLFRTLPADRQNTVRAAAGAYHRAGTHTPVKAWKQALGDDWRAYLATVPVPDEDTFRHCMTVLGTGEVHTASGLSDEDHAIPQCRTGGQNTRLTRYRFVTGEITCATCIEYRRRRAVARAKRATPDAP